MKKTMKKNRLRGQSTLEYAMVVAIIAAAVIAMQFYIKRAVEGRAKQAGDEISEPYDSELMASSAITTRVNSTTTIFSTPWQMGDEFVVRQDVDKHEEVTRTGSEHLNPW
jgi:uncharacterized protein (UPF0333 family)